MQVMIEIVGRNEGRKGITLQKGQMARFGRSAWMDFQVEEDPDMAEEHFCITTEDGQCHLQDRSRGVGTRVNGKNVSQIMLKDEDQIRAGQSHFIVRTVGTSHAGNERVAPTVVPDEPGESGKPTALSGEFETVQCSTNVHCSLGLAETANPVQVAELFRGRCPMYLLVDPRRVDLPAQPEERQAHYLFDWLGDAAKTMSPVLLSDSNADLMAVLDSGWGQDGLISLFSKNGPEELLGALREAARPTPDVVVGICWPSILGPLLDAENSPMDFNSRLLKAVSAVLVERNGGELWHVYTPQSVGAFLSHAGMTQQESSSETNDHSDEESSSAHEGS